MFNIRFFGIFGSELGYLRKLEQNLKCMFKLYPNTVYIYIKLDRKQLYLPNSTVPGIWAVSVEYRNFLSEKNFGSLLNANFLKFSFYFVTLFWCGVLYVLCQFALYEQMNLCITDKSLRHKVHSKNNHFIGHNFLRQKFFTSKFFYAKIFYAKFFLRQDFLRQNFFTQRFFNAKKHFLRQKTFLCRKHRISG